MILAQWYVRVSDLSLRAAIHALQSFIHSSFSPCDSEAPDLSDIATCIHAFILSLLQVMYQLHGTVYPALFLLPFMYRIHGLMPPSPSALLVMRQVEDSTPH